MITTRTLRALTACPEGIRAFEQEYPEGLALAAWTREEEVRILRTPLGRYVGWALAQGILPGWSLSGANLSGADLYGANLRGANLSGANLSGAYRPEAPPDGWEEDADGYMRRVPAAARKE